MKEETTRNQDVDGKPETSDGPDTARKEAEEFLKRQRRAWTRKTGLTTLALVMVILGTVSSFIIFAKLQVLLDRLVVNDVFEFCRHHAEETLNLPLDNENVVTVTRMVQVLIITIINLALFVIATGVTYVLSFRVAGARAGRMGETSEYSRNCVLMTNGGFGMGWVLMGSAVLVLAAGILGNFYLFSLTWLLQLIPFIIGLSFALFSLGQAAMIRLPFSLAQPEDLPELPQVSAPETREARLTGKELLGAVRRSPIYRRQLVCEHTMSRVPYAEADGLEDLLQRYPLLRPLLDDMGIESLTTDQTHALHALLASESTTTGGDTDICFIGWPGSGRTTLANLLTLGCVLHREGAMYCVAAESPQRSVDVTGKTDYHTRHPVTQLREWLHGTRYEPLINIQEAYSDQKDRDIKFSMRPDFVFTDVGMLSRLFLSKATGDARSMLERLRYVVIDHPNRLSREDFLRLRVAIARLRMTAHLFGRQLNIIIMLPRLDNHADLAKNLLGNKNVPFYNFAGWSPGAELFVWQPPHELLDFNENAKPQFVLSDFWEETRFLLAEIGFQSHLLTLADKEPLRVGVIDAQPLLGPEAREQLREQIRGRLIEEVGEEDSIRITGGWTYFGTTEIAIDRRRCFDVIVCLGIGAHASHVVASLRPALAAQGALIMVSDASPLDWASVQEMSEADWDPYDELRTSRYPSLAYPTHSNAIVAHELASLFEDFGTQPIPRQRLLDIFAGEFSEQIMNQWESRGAIEGVQVFEFVNQASKPEIVSYVRRADPTFGGSQYEVPRGCCTRKVCRIFDAAAHEYSKATGPHSNEYIDRERAFIDLYPQAILRFPPNSVIVERQRQRQLTTEEQRVAQQRFVIVGDIVVEQRGWGQNVTIDRRQPRFAVELLDERPLARSESSTTTVGSHEDAELEALADALQIGDATDDSRDALARDKREERRRRILGGIEQQAIGARAARPALRLASGSWVTRIEEAIRDIVMTDQRLIEEPDFVTVSRLNPDLRQQMTRRFDCVSVNLFLLTGTVRDGEDRATALPGFEGAFGSYAAHYGLARVISLYLQRRYMNFTTEYRVAVVPNRTEVTGLTGYRFVLYRLRELELGPERLLSWLVRDTPSLVALMRWAHGLLEGCTCVDGCSACCAGLGVIPEDAFDHQVDQQKFSGSDVVSRRGAYLLVCGLLGLDPAWDRFYKNTPAGQDENEDVAGEHELQPYVVELIGTPGDSYRDGIWTRLFERFMEFDPQRVARAEWAAKMPPGLERALGYYTAKENKIVVLKGQSREKVKEILVHEFAHNWQFTSGQLDFEELCEAPENRCFFDGQLVLEGHARWADHMYRVSLGRGPVYAPGDSLDWDEYKVGYFLMEGIEKAVGQYGLFSWLKAGVDASRETLRSRNKALEWPFTLKQALQGIKPPQESRSLYEYAIRGPFSSHDVLVDTAETTGNGDEPDAQADATDETDGATAV